LISGPNMAGKSTFVRGVGINTVLAQCGATVQAKRLRLSPLAVGASILLTGCNTVAGAGQDISNSARTVQKAL